MRRIEMLPLAGLLLSGAIKAARVFDASPVDITAVFAFMVVVQCGANLIRHKFIVPRITPWVIAAYATLLPAAVWAPATELAAAKVADLFTIALLAVLSPLLLIRERRHLLELAAWLAVLGGVAALDALFVTQTTATAGLRLRFGDQGSPLSLARSASTALVVLAVAAARRDLHWAFAASLAVPLVGVLLRTASQGPAAAVIVGVVVVAFVYGLGRRRWLAFGVIAATATAVATLGMQTTTVEQRERLLSVGTSEQDRLDMWGASLDIASGSPAGIGWGAFSQLDERYDYPHNVWIETFLEGGWLAGCVFVAATLLVAGRLTRCVRTDLMALYPLALLGSWTVNAAFTGSLPSNRPLLGLLTVGALTPMVIQRYAHQTHGRRRVSMSSTGERSTSTGR
jgi:O-antigen ligase